ncbi:hypothetical protein NHX12_016933, partial [Muraenolepis orangiensis]
EKREIELKRDARLETSSKNKGLSIECIARLRKRLAFGLEVSQMKKANLEEMRGMEVEREVLLNIKILKTDHNNNSVNNIKTARPSRPLKIRRNTDDLNSTCKVLGLTEYNGSVILGTGLNHSCSDTAAGGPRKVPIAFM